jgi:hypothetical protein
VSENIDEELKPVNDRAEDLARSDQSEKAPESENLSPELQTNGDFMAGEQRARDPQVNLAWIIGVLRQSLPPSDPRLSDLIRVLRLIRDFHLWLNDWNELHNQLSDILFNYSQFSREVERLSDSNEDPEPRTIGIHWHPVAQRVTALLDWASAPRSIFEGEPFARLQDRIVGPPWAVELCKSCDRLDALLRPADLSRLFTLPRESITSRPQYVDINELYDAGSDFYDVAERWMYLVDRRVHEITKELLSLSHSVFNTLEDDGWTA